MHDIDLYGVELPQFPGYRIFRDGEVKGLKGEPLSPFTNDQGYCQLGLYVGGYRKAVFLHRLVAAAYRGLDYDNSSMHVDHINENKADCRAENLDPVTQSVNQVRRSEILKTRTHKFCSDCIKNLPMDSFGIIKKTGHRESICRECNKIRGRKQYAALKAKRAVRE